MSTERRASSRITINKDFESIEEFIAEYATDISLSGCFIRSKHPLPVGTRVNLRFTVIASDLEIVEGVGEVVRVVSPPSVDAGMGVRFTKLSAASQRRIRDLTGRQDAAENA